MDRLEPNPILEFNSNQLAEVRTVFNYSDLTRLHQDLNIFENWIKMQQHFVVKVYGKEYLERYLISSKGSIERAKKLLDKICTLRGLMPQYLTGFDIENEFKNLHKVMHVCVFPKPTAEHYRILLYNIHNPDTAIFEHITANRYLLMIFQYFNFYDYNAGIEIICDTRNFTFGVVTKLSPIVLANTATIAIEALGLRLRGIHLINGSKFIDAIIVFLKQGLSKKLASRLYVYDNYESLHKRFPKNILPKNLGGDLSTVEEIVANNFKEFSSPTFIEQMKYIESATTDESKRLCSKFTEGYSGMPGSFKALIVD